MREIKFRAWHNKKMLYSVTVVNGRFIKAGAELMQCAGLKDKNKKDFFEHDIIKSGKKELFIIYFEDGTFVGRQISGFNAMPLKYMIDNYSIEIMGNIHENPELLK